MGEKVNFCVPTGNFGEHPGLPATPSQHGPAGGQADLRLQQQQRADGLPAPPAPMTGTGPSTPPCPPRWTFWSPAILERLLFALSGQDDQADGPGYMEQLNEHGQLHGLRRHQGSASGSDFCGGFCGEADDQPDHRRGAGRSTATSSTPTPPWRYHVMEHYRKETGDDCTDRLRLHRQPLQVLRQRAAQPGGGPGGRRRGRLWTSCTKVSGRAGPCAPGLPPGQGRALHLERGQGAR